MKFALAIHKEPESDYGVTVLDLPGCFSSGETIDDAMDQAKEAIECHLDAMIQDEEAIPQPNPLEYHKNNPDYSDAIFAYVDVDINKLTGPAQRINITLPKWVLRQMDLYAKRESLARSTLIANAALEYIKSHSKSG
jgi:predicted RNase H-like HicB family nuclease